MKWLTLFAVCPLALSLACQKKTSGGEIPVAPMPAVPLTAEDTLPWVTYHIPQGAHYSLEDTFSFFPYDTLRFRFSFNESARYKNANPLNQRDWNKLLGFSDCGGHHQQNSARLVWRYDTLISAVEIGWYTYTNAHRAYAALDTVSIHDTLRAVLFRTDQKYTFEVEKQVITLDRLCNSRVFSYALLPYFGGDEAASQDIQIHVQHLAPLNL